MGRPEEKEQEPPFYDITYWRWQERTMKVGEKKRKENGRGGEGRRRLHPPIDRGSTHFEALKAVVVVDGAPTSLLIT